MSTYARWKHGFRKHMIRLYARIKQVIRKAHSSVWERRRRWRRNCKSTCYSILVRTNKKNRKNHWSHLRQCKRKHCRFNLCSRATVTRSSWKSSITTQRICVRYQWSRERLSLWLRWSLGARTQTTVTSTRVRRNRWNSLEIASMNRYKPASSHKISTVLTCESTKKSWASNWDRLHSNSVRSLCMSSALRRDLSCSLTNLAKQMLNLSNSSRWCNNNNHSNRLSRSQPLRIPPPR